MSGLVLIVDDDEALSENLAEIVQELGVRTVIALDRQSALAQAAAHDFDVALIDVRLPDGDGLTLLGPLRERSPHLQAVMVTGNACGRRGDGGRARRGVRLRRQARLRARAAGDRPAGARSGGACTASASASAASWKARRNATESWSNRSPRSCWRWTRRAGSRPGTASSNASPVISAPRCWATMAVASSVTTGARPTYRSRRAASARSAGAAPR